MLAFERQARFEQWLQQCPLDQRCMKYSVERKFDGLTVTCSWTLPAGVPVATAPHPPPAVVATDQEPKSDQGNDTAAEIAATRDKMAALQKMIASASANSGASSTDSGGGSGNNGGAAIAAKLLERGAPGSDTSVEGVRAALQSIGVALPKPPGPQSLDG